MAALYLFIKQFWPNFLALLPASALFGFDEYAKLWLPPVKRWLDMIPARTRRYIEIVILIGVTFFAGFQAWKQEHEARVSDAMNCMKMSTPTIVTVTAPAPILESLVAVPRGIYVTVNTSTIKKYSETHRLMFVAVRRSANSDKMTDPYIQRSPFYSIDGEQLFMRIAPPFSFMRGPPDPQDSIEVYVMLFPAEKTRLLFKTLSELERAGSQTLVTGSILASDVSDASTDHQCSFRAHLAPPAQLGKR